MTRVRIAVLDDEPRVAAVVAMVLDTADREIRTYHHPQAFLNALEAEPFDLLVSDLRMPDLDGLEVLTRARRLEPDLPVILISAHGTVSAATEAMRLGAVDFLCKPFDNEVCRATVERALSLTKLQRDTRYLRSTAPDLGVPGAIAVSVSMQGVFELARRAARGRATVLVGGETGTGKELVARSVHYHSPRVGEPFVAVNCKALASSVLESELFGHVAGAFTGAQRTRRGLFERADGGTLFLDEIGDIDLQFQAKLLRVLQEGEVQRVGDDRPHAVDVRVVAATHRDLAEEVAAGRFREDLYYRLAVIPLHIPPLRERTADILPLATHFLARHQERMGTVLTGWSGDVERWLLSHAWPGNVRELDNLMERAATLATGSEITLEDLLLRGAAPMSPPTTLAEVVDRATKTAVQEALDGAPSKAEAARRLGVDRTTLYRLMDRYQLR